MKPLPCNPIPHNKHPDSPPEWWNQEEYEEE